MIAVSILSDSLGLMTDSTTPHSIRIIADLVEQGVNLPQLEDTRRQMMQKPGTCPLQRRTFAARRIPAGGRQP